jgi:hypothetical protein
VFESFDSVTHSFDGHRGAAEMEVSAKQDWFLEASAWWGEGGLSRPVGVKQLRTEPTGRV